MQRKDIHSSELRGFLEDFLDCVISLNTCDEITIERVPPMTMDGPINVDNLGSIFFYL